MGHRIDGLTWYKDDEIISSGEAYNPYDDLNQMAEVVEKLMRKKSKYLTSSRHYMYYGIMAKGIKQALRDFITSTVAIE